MFHSEETMQRGKRKLVQNNESNRMLQNFEYTMYTVQERLVVNATSVRIRVHWLSMPPDGLRIVAAENVDD